MSLRGFPQYDDKDGNVFAWIINTCKQYRAAPSKVVLTDDKPIRKRSPNIATQGYAQTVKFKK